MPDRGFVKLPRAIRNSVVWQDANLLKFYTYLLLEASFTKREVLVRGSIRVVLNPGQLLYSRRRASEETGLSERQCTKYLKLLESIKEVDYSKHAFYSVITLRHYSGGVVMPERPAVLPSNDDDLKQDNQADRSSSVPQVHRNCPTLTTYSKKDNNDKKDKNDKNENISKQLTDSDVEYAMFALEDALKQIPYGSGEYLRFEDSALHEAVKRVGWRNLAVMFRESKGDWHAEQRWRDMLWRMRKLYAALAQRETSNEEFIAGGDGRFPTRKERYWFVSRSGKCVLLKETTVAKQGVVPYNAFKPIHKGEEDEV